MKLPEVTRFLLKLQEQTDSLTDKLKKAYVQNHDYWDGYNDALLKCQADLKKMFKL